MKSTLHQIQTSAPVAINRGLWGNINKSSRFCFSGIESMFREELGGSALLPLSIQQKLDMALVKFVKKHRVVLSHMGVWLGFLTLWALTIVPDATKPENIFKMLVTFMPAAYTFYGSNFVFFRFLPQRKVASIVIAEILFFISCFIVISLEMFVLQPIAYGTAIGFPTTVTPWVEILMNEALWMYLILSTLSLGYYHLRQSLKRAKELKVSQKLKLEAEKGKLEAEYAFLRAQINPHFLHNTLNFFYAKSLGHSEELSNGILTLCDIMRYSLESEEDENGTVLLTKEVEHLWNVIKINQLRFSNRLQIDFQICGELEGVRIIPLVLITLVENAFKHGELSNSAHPIQFILDVHAQEFTFSASNKKRKGPKESSHGIGLDNTRKRLAAAYPDCHTLTVQDEEDFYAISLTIKLAQGKYSYTSKSINTALPVSI